MKRCFAVWVLVLGACALHARQAAAHELDPAYLGFTETAPGLFAVVWKVSIPGGLVDVLAPQLPDRCALRGERHASVVSEARVVRGEISCPDGLPGSTIGVDGLELTSTDTLIRIDYLDGRSFSARLTPHAATLVVPAEASAFDVVGTYTALGIEHILLGIDHLLFVFALLLFVASFRRLVLTVTAFTVAHSLTLAAATLGFVHVPQAPVEATIALSILFLASELARRERSRDDDLAARFPWLVAFSFGLLHGFGFAGALTQIGLPQRAVPLALLFFNVGVELGQLAFIGAVLGLGWMLARFAVPQPAGWRKAAAYAIGSVSAFWVLQRVAAFL
jgi:hydrogenase/urease accessory protein HupE